LPAILQSGLESSYIAYGLGRSYGDAALNAKRGVISTARLNRFLSFDDQTGVLECESGVGLAEIVRHFLPRGFFLPVTPGTKFITMGGAIAGDIHGKNHHRDGSIANYITSFQLLTPNGQILTCSPAQNTEIFWATVGGMGLTGFILTARIQLRRVESGYVLVDYRKAGHLDEALDLMADSDQQYEYSVAWIDCLANGQALGRSVLMRGNHATAAEVRARHRDPLAAPTRPHLNVRWDSPTVALNRYTVRAFNTLYYRLHRASENQLVDFESFFYPLDSVENWNRLYGRRGFVQYQVAIPEENGRRSLRVLVGRLARSGRSSFLAVLKQFGEPDPGLLSFPIKGYTLALDLPVAGGLVPFLRELDRIVVDAGGRIYLAKDAVLEPETFAASYPRLNEFRAVKHKLDPNGLFSSSLARRLRIAD